MPELPEVEAWIRELDPQVSMYPIELAGPAHIATLKTFDPPLDTLEGRRLGGARRRGKNLLFPTEDDELVLRVHLMSAGRLRFLPAGAKGPKTPMFRLRFQGGDELVLTEAGQEEARGRLADDAGADRRGSLAPRPRRPRRRPCGVARDPRARAEAAAPAPP